MARNQSNKNNGAKMKLKKQALMKAIAGASKENKSKT